MEREENQRRELERSYDTKRRKTTDDPDSTISRRALPDQLDSRDARDNGMLVYLDHDHLLIPLEDHASGRSHPQIDGPRTAPVGPRRRDGLHPRREMDSYRPDPSSDIRSRDDLYPARPARGPDRDRERDGSRLELPTGPRAMESDSYRRDSHYHRQSFEGPSTNDSISESRGSVQPLPADNRSRQHNNRNRRDEGPRDNGEVLPVLLHTIFFTILTIPLLDRAVMRHQLVTRGMTLFILTGLPRLLAFLVPIPYL